MRGFLIFSNNPLIFTAYTCTPGQFKCSDGTCISQSKLCDGLPDCMHGTDEMNCGMCILKISTQVGNIIENDLLRFGLNK